MSRPRDRVRLSAERLEDRATPAALPDYAAGRVLVTVARPNRDAEYVAALARSPLAADVTPVGLGVYRVDLRPGVSVPAAAWLLGRGQWVKSATPDYRIAASAVPNDPRFGQQWGLHNTAQSAGYRADADIDAPEAWAVARGTGNTVVAVIDSGIDYRHPDLAPNMWRNPREVPGNGRDDDGNGFVDDVFGADFRDNDGDPLDTFGHGTHAAGIAGAAGNDGVGVAGVAQRTRLMALRFMDGAAGGFTSDAVRAIDYALANGAKVINASWGGAPYNAALDAAVGRARGRGAIVVAAAGNDGRDIDASPFYPASYITRHDNVVTVAATDFADALPGWSNRGRSTVTLAAPGENVFSTLPNGGYGLKSGTSMAAPFVSGAVAVLWDQNPTWTYQQVIARLKATVDPLPALAGRTQTGGRLNLARLVGAPPLPAPPPATPTPPAPPTGAGPRVTAGGFVAVAAGGFDRARVTFDRPVDPNSFTAADVTVGGPAGAVRVSAVLAVGGTNNTQFQVMFSARQTAGGAYTLGVGPDVRDAAGRAMDQNGNGVGGEAADRYTVGASLAGPAPATPAAPPPPPTPAPAPNRVTFTAGGTAIQELRTNRVSIPVTQEFTVAGLTVTLDVAHGRTSDLSIRLVSPTGQIVQLFTRRTGSGLTATVFDDAAARAIGGGSGTFAGGFRPEQSLAAFNGRSARGVWELQVFDLAGGVTGRVNGVTLSFTRPSAGGASALQRLTAADTAGASADFRAAALGGRG